MAPLVTRTFSGVQEGSSSIPCTRFSRVCPQRLRYGFTPLNRLYSPVRKVALSNFSEMPLLSLNASKALHSRSLSHSKSCPTWQQDWTKALTGSLLIANRSDVSCPKVPACEMRRPPGNSCALLTNSANTPGASAGRRSFSVMSGFSMV